MTNAELKFNEPFPAFLKRIAEATEKIAEELSKTNRLRALDMLVEGATPAFKNQVMKIVEGAE